MTAQVRKWFYLISGVLAALIPVAVQVGIFDTGQADSSATLLASLAGLLGGTGAITAAHHVNKQIKSGMHDPALSPIDQIQAAIPEVLAQAAQANANVDKLREVTGDLLGNGVDVLSAVAPAAGSLADQVLNQIIPR
jgi:hypothetical protein